MSKSKIRRDVKKLYTRNSETTTTVIPDFFQNPAFCVMGSRSRSGRFERGEERTRGSRDETFSYREVRIFIININ
ncbi:UNVERIFIED_CONTAM: hypothetical protein NCL1_30657 [Trichonephila clavipes]